MKSKDLRLLLTFGGSRTLFFGSFFATIINTAIVAGNAFLIASLIVGIIDGAQGVGLLTLEIALLWAGRAIFLSQFDKWASTLASSSKESLRTHVLQSSEILAATPSTHLSTLMIKGGNSLDIYFARFIPQFFSALITPISIIAILFILDPLSALIAIVTIPLIPVFGALIGRFTQDAVDAKWRALGTLGKYFEDSLRGIHTLSIFSRLKGQAKRIEEMGDRYTDETMKVLRISFLSALVLELAATISVALIAVSVGLRLVNGSIEFWPSLSILILAPEVYFPLRNAASLFHASADGGAALNEIDQLLSTHSDLKDDGELELTHVEEISWSNWSSPFGAGSLPARTLKPGESLVIRGGSGLGKTTFINAILGYGDTRGLSINGQEISRYRKHFVSSCIGWIPQNPALISGTLRELFQYLKADIADDEIEFTLSKVGLHLKDLPDGLETTIGGLGEKSGTLSGGQIRRIAIARAIVQSPSIVIADEPTADLDPKSAEEILRLLEDIASSGAIVIAVLHAPDHTLSGADEIAIVER